MFLSASQQLSNITAVTVIMSSDLIHFQQLNMHKAATASAELNHSLGEVLQVALLTEPYTAHNKVVSIPQGYRAYPSTPLEQPPRAAIVYPSHLVVTALTNLSTPDCAVALLKANRVGYVICSLYMDITKPIPTTLLQNILDLARRRHYKVIIGSDTNAHSSLFGPSNNRRGDDLEDCIAQLQLNVENIGMTPTFQAVRAGKLYSSCIDATLTWDQPDIQGWRVLPGFNGSDHKSIVWQLNT